MSPYQAYKHWEEAMTKRGRRRVKDLVGRFTQAFRRLKTGGGQNYTVMIVPHSEQKIVSFKISVYALNLLAVIAVSIGAVLVYYAVNHSALSRQLELKGSQAELAQINLGMVREEVAQLRIVAEDFESLMTTTLGTIGIATSAQSQDIPSGAEGTPPPHELMELRDLRRILEAGITPVDQVGNVLSSQKSLLVEIPTLWPLKEVRGWVTTPFGPSIHPFTGQWYLHKGIDIAQRIGTPIVATADGKISRVDYEALGYGHYVDIKHNYGFLTKYGHLHRSYVSRGQDVVRGQVIGGLGSSGLSTGPHLHYEVRIGTQVVDPSKYLRFSTSLLTD